MAELLQVDCEMFGLTSDHYSITLRRYAGMALTNLTFGDVANKVGRSRVANKRVLVVYRSDAVVFHQATLCSMKGCMRAMVAQLKSDSEDLQQVRPPGLRTWTSSQELPPLTVSTFTGDSQRVEEPLVAS